MSRTAAGLLFLAWLCWLPLAVETIGRLQSRRPKARPPVELAADERLGSSRAIERPRLELVQSTLGERLRADQRNHRARWAQPEGDDVA